MSQLYPSHDNNQYSTRNRRIRSLFIQQTGTYQNQWRRPMQLECTSALQDQLVNAFCANTKISAIDLVSSDSQLIMPTAQPETAVGIVNGWDTPRLKFWMVIDIGDNIGGVDVINVQGYTEHADLSASGHFDPRMAFFINNITQSKTARVNNVTLYNPQYSLQMLHNSTHAGFQSSEQVFGLTPMNVFNQMGNLDMFYGADQSFAGTGMLYDTTNHVTATPKVASRSNSLTTEYAGRIINAYVGEKLSDRTDPDGEQRSSTFFNNCQTLVDDSKKLERNDFVKFLQHRRGQMVQWGATIDTNVFSLDDLLAYDPAAMSPDVLRLIPADGGIHVAGMTASWQSSDQETLFATIISEGVSSLAAQCGMNKVVFSASNRLTPDGSVHFSYEDFRTINSDAAANRDATTFRYRVETELLSIASYANQLGYNVHVSCDLGGETHVRVQLEGHPEVYYVRPTFCDALLSSLVSNKSVSLDSLSSGFEDLGENLYQAKQDASRSFNAGVITSGVGGVFNHSQPPASQGFFNIAQPTKLF